jgi:hypothetical protein
MIKAGLFFKEVQMRALIKSTVYEYLGHLSEITVSVPVIVSNPIKCRIVPYTNLVN